MVIGDGISEETRESLAPLLSVNERLHLVDRPKSIRHGEEYRDEVILDSSAEYITYLCDDDLLLPHHLETMLNVIEGVDFANPFPVFIRPDGSIFPMAMDLGFPGALDWHLNPKIRRNSVSLTGVMHTRKSYLRLKQGWRPAPTDRWTDHFMWQQFFTTPGLTFRTSPRSTTAKFPANLRGSDSPEQLNLELSTFTDMMRRPEFSVEWDARVAEAVRYEAVRLQIENDLVRNNVEAGYNELARELEAIRHTWSWRLTRPLRSIRRMLRRR